MLSKKTISPVVAIALLLVVAVVAVVGFQGWFQSYSSSMFSDVEIQSSTSELGIETLIGTSLYIKSLSEENITINRLTISGVECIIEKNLSYGMNELNVSSCLSSVTDSTPEIVLISENNIVEKSVYLKNIVIVSESIPGPDFSNDFISVWNTSKGGSATDTILLPLQSATGDYNFTVYWGDGNNQTVTSRFEVPISHTYSSPGVYQINITGKIDGFRFANIGDKLKIIEIQNWGSLRVGGDGAFYGCLNLEVSAIDELNLTGESNLGSMFRYTHNFNQDLSSWDVSNVIYMNNMFRGAKIFNQDLSSWDVSSVTDMAQMFYLANSFNQDLSSWDVSSVTDMILMFYGASRFNGSIDNWNVSKVITMDNMFNSASDFNRNISSWNTSKVTNMAQMFYLANSFNQDLSSWNVSSITIIPTNCDNFNLDAPSWTLPKPALDASCLP